VKPLAGVMVGDKLKCAYGRTNDFSIYTVARLTKTLAVCTPAASFKLSDGLKMGTGGSWHSQYASFLTKDDLDEKEARIRLNKAKALIQNVRVTPENLDAVEAFLKAIKP
jgi:hypothetical protein